MRQFFQVLIFSLLWTEKVFSHENNDILANDLLAACNNNYQEEILHLVEQNISVNTQDYLGTTCLMRAAYNNHLDIGMFLINSRAIVDLTDFGGATALQIATRRGNLEFVKLLIQSGSNVNSYDKSGNNVLMKAISYSHPEIADLLLNGAVDISLRNRLNYSVFKQAANKEYWEILEKLVKMAKPQDLDFEEKKYLIMKAKKFNRKNLLEMLENLEESNIIIEENLTLQLPELPKFSNFSIEVKDLTLETIEDNSDRKHIKLLIENEVLDGKKSVKPILNKLFKQN